MRSEAAIADSGGLPLTIHVGPSRANAASGKRNIDGTKSY